MKLDDLECKENIDIDEYHDYFLNTKNEMEKLDWFGDLEKDDYNVSLRKISELTKISREKIRRNYKINK